jgi:hypothetical protein
MSAHYVARVCEDKHCPAIITTTTGDVAVQGYIVADPNTVLPTGADPVPAGETVVTIPAEQFGRLVAAYLLSTKPVVTA